MSKKRKTITEQSTIVVDEGKRFDDSRDVLTSDPYCDRLSPDAIVSTNIDHVEVVDMGRTAYMRSFYVEELPKDVRLGYTFAKLYGQPHVTVSVVADVMSEGAAVSLFDKKIKVGEREAYGATSDTNRFRRISKTVGETTEWAKQAENGRKFFLVRWLFLVRATSLEELDKACDLFVTDAAGCGIKLVACYGMQLEAFLANGPYNTVYTGPRGMDFPAKEHMLVDTAAAAVLFNHVNTYFSHPTGVPIGRTMDNSHAAILFDPYAKVHNGFCAAFVGMIGVGKSALVKMLAGRLNLFDYHFACVDVQQVEGKGEYARLCEFVGGVVFEISSDSQNRLNLFELTEHMEYNRLTGRDVRKLNLADKTENLSNIILSAIIGKKNPPEFELASYLEILLKRCIFAVYNNRGIFDGEPDSLYEQANVFEDGKISAGRKKKEMPAISDLYLEILREHREDCDVPLHNSAWQILEDSVSDLVNELYYDAETLEKVDEKIIQTYLALDRPIVCVRGTRGYFDGQSTIFISNDLPFIDIDLSALPDSVRDLGQLVAFSFLNEYFIKPNSDNATDAKKLILIADEAHMHFAVPNAAASLEILVRTARKRNAGVWVITQALIDFEKSRNTRAILSNCSSTFIFKQSTIDAEYILENTPLTKSQVARLLSMGGDPNDAEDRSHKGEVCLIDMNRVVFFKSDYLKETEAAFVESDMEEIRKMRQ